MTSADNNESLAIGHMQRLVGAIKLYRSAPESLRPEYATKARVQAKLLRQCANAANDNTLTWAANEADDLVRQFVGGAS